MRRTGEAHAALTQGLELANERFPKIGIGDLGRDWSDWIIAQALLRQAEALVEGQTGGQAVQSPRSKVSQPASGEKQPKSE